LKSKPGRWHKRRNKTVLFLPINRRESGGGQRFIGRNNSPGSFGELRDTVTLDCLKYVGSVQKNGVEHVLIKDETGNVHVLRRNSYMGENSGHIVDIDPDAIYLEQIINRNGDWEVITVKFAKR
jgi:Tfp pilus assembly protein PilP